MCIWLVTIMEDRECVHFIITLWYNINIMVPPTKCHRWCIAFNNVMSQDRECLWTTKIISRRNNNVISWMLMHHHNHLSCYSFNTCNLLCTLFSTTKTLLHTVNCCIESLLQNICHIEVFTLLNHCVNKASDVVTVFQQGTLYFSYRSGTRWVVERTENEWENRSYTEQFVYVLY